MLDLEQLADDALAIARARLWAGNPTAVMPDWTNTPSTTLALVQSYAEHERRGWTPPDADE